ncbi:Uncharacterised protein [Mycobacteroides abscessus subsp. abscessus]|nr:Uncharacterised protein [Mycobacteroides abscessus subsp. abscessus]
MAHPATTTVASTMPTISELDCDRIGSWIIRTSRRTSACSMRRTRNRYPLTCSRVVGCRAIVPPPGNTAKLESTT